MQMIHRVVFMGLFIMLTVYSVFGREFSLLETSVPVIIGIAMALGRWRISNYAVIELAAEMIGTAILIALVQLPLLGIFDYTSSKMPGITLSRRGKHHSS